MAERASLVLWRSGAAWRLSCADKTMGDVVLSAVTQGKGVRQDSTISYRLGLRKEFTQEMVPAYALRLLAFFEMASKHQAVINAGLEYAPFFHREANWQLNLYSRVCEASRGSGRVSKPEEAPDDWTEAFRKVAEGLEMQQRLFADLLRDYELVCTEEVWRKLLRWYYSNKEGKDMVDEYRQLPPEVLPLVDKTVDGLADMEMPPILEFLKSEPDKPIAQLRPSAESEQKEMKMTLAELLGLPDRDKLLTKSKPKYVEVKAWQKDGGAFRVTDESWCPLHNKIWQEAWKDKNTAIVACESLVVKKSTDDYKSTPKYYLSLDDTYAVYKNNNTIDLVTRLGRLLGACGVPNEDVELCFLTNAPGSQETERDVDQSPPSDAEEHSQPKTDVDLNTILYGPPGTGKTYHTMAYAVAICDGRRLADVKEEARKVVQPRFRELMDAGRIGFVTFHQSYEYGDFMEGLAPEVKDGAVTYTVKPGAFLKFCRECGDEPCVFIIDEINRGNISKILGELITLVEPSKRDTQFVTLPVSGERFTVPSNVYLLGTMNTADRSLAMMDTALRRRFDFVRMDPDPKLLHVNAEGVDVPHMLKTMNERISWLLDAEHTLGHALFWEVRDNPTLEQLGHIFRKKVIPLLQEYFHDDDRKVKLVLGGSPMLEQAKVRSGLFASEDTDQLPERYAVLAADKDLWNDAATYTAIYSGVEKQNEQG